MEEIEGSIKKERPTGITVISILYFIASGLVLIGALLAFLGAGIIAVSMSGDSILAALAKLGITVFIITGVILLVVSILSFFLGRGLWKLQQWARITIIVLNSLSLLTTVILLILSTMAIFGTDTVNLIGLVFTLISLLVSLGINLLIILYLAFSSKVKEAFSKTTLPEDIEY